MQTGEDFAFETTLSTRSYVSLIKKAQALGYSVHLCYFWLESPQLALRRVKSRVAKGGHHIPENVILRRYYRSVDNLTSLYIPIADKWSVHDNTHKKPALVAEGDSVVPSNISIPERWFLINKQTDVMEHYNQGMYWKYQQKNCWQNTKEKMQKNCGCNKKGSLLYNHYKLLRETCCSQHVSRF